jgi:hypothetical protein
VCGKEAILFLLAKTAVAHPDDTVRTALFPVVGEKTLRELVREAKANEHAFQKPATREGLGPPLSDPGNRVAWRRGGCLYVVVKRRQGGIRARLVLAAGRACGRGAWRR